MHYAHHYDFTLSEEAFVLHIGGIREHYIEEGPGGGAGRIDKILARDRSFFEVRGGFYFSSPQQAEFCIGEVFILIFYRQIVF